LIDSTNLSPAGLPHSKSREKCNNFQKNLILQNSEKNKYVWLKEYCFKNFQSLLRIAGLSPFQNMNDI